MASSPSSLSSVPDQQEKSLRLSEGSKSEAQKDLEKKDLEKHDPAAADRANTGDQFPSVMLAQNASRAALAPDMATHSGQKDVFSVLRGTADGSQPPDSVIRAAAEAARILTVADGVAIAFRTKGAILCRARCGELAPELGSFVDANSGISGECLRTASILVCNDARVDTRVDNVVCQRMGLRSIVVVPLRGPVGISGILEVFSTRLNAFGEREINSLRGLAELAENAYERERLAQQEATRAALRSAHRLPALLARAVDSDSRDRELRQVEDEIGDPRPERILWVIGAATAALLLILGIWLSWHGPISELTELEAGQTHSAVQSVAQPKLPLPAPKPTAGTIRSESEKRSGSSRNGSHEEKTASNTVAREQTNADSRPPNATAYSTTSSDAASSASAVLAPVVRFTSAADLGEFPKVISAHEPLPVMGAPVSHGVTQGALIHKVDPVYPPLAREQGIAGPVVIQIHVGKDGGVRDIDAISGDPMLKSAALDAVRQWQYAPTLLDGHPIETTKQVTVVFKLP